MSDPSGSLFPNFIRRSLVMGAPIGSVAVLIHIKIFFGLGRNNFPHAQDRAVGAFIPRRDDQFRAKSLENFLALFACACRQAKFHSIPKRRGNHGVCDPGVSAGRVQNGLARLQLPRALRFANHLQRRTILYRAAGIEPFRLAIKFHIGIIRADSFEAQERRIPDTIENVLTDDSGSRRLFGPKWLFCRVHVSRYSLPSAANALEGLFDKPKAMPAL